VGISLYGVLNYSVNAKSASVTPSLRRLPTLPAESHVLFFMVCVGSLVGVALGMILVHYAETLLYEVKSTNPIMLAIPVLTILLASLLAAVPAVVRALGIDPVEMLRAQ